MAECPFIPTVVISIISCLIFSICSGVPSTVFFTFAKLFSKSIANLALATPPAASAVAAYCNGLVTVSIPSPTSFHRLPVFCRFCASSARSAAFKPFSYSSYCSVAFLTVACASVYAFLLPDNAASCVRIESDIL